jgi:DNA helicase-2/ATP-dependent DNA helicase PcrA
MEQSGLYDFDDMILNVVHAIETQPDLKFNLQEKYQYIMVDEFQDTNLAQLRILFNLAENPITGDAPNVMAVGDDDQAIYSFQGADLNNIHAYRNHFKTAVLIPLIDNYRSAATILTHAREVITQGSGRLETTIEGLNKQLAPHYSPMSSLVEITEHRSALDERAWLAEHINAAIESGKQPSDIAVLARRHSERLELLPYLYHRNIAVNYERRDNVLELPVIAVIQLTSNVVIAIQQGKYDIADSLLPELLAHDSFTIPAELIWKVSLESYKKHQLWLETIATYPELTGFHGWLIDLAKKSLSLTLEQMLDEIIGLPNSDSERTFISPVYNYYFSQDSQPDTYITMLEGLRTIRQKLRDYSSEQSHTLIDFIEFIELHQSMNIGITSIRKQSEHITGSINLMTAHKAKGLEFDTVYIVNAIDTAWGERVRTKSSFIGYPANLRQLTTAGGNYDERLRLFFVSMTRAKKELYISFATEDANGKPTLAASFLSGTSLTAKPATHSANSLATLETHEVAWKDAVVSVSSKTMKELLTPVLDTYKLSVTHLNNFIDVTDGGPKGFMMKNLLHFPQAKSANASYGTAVHAALQRAHMHLITTGDLRPVEDVLRDFENELIKQHMPEHDFETFQKKGIASLSAFLNQHYHTFSTTQKTELGFSNQGVVLGTARLTGALDLIDIKDKAITVTDYKTGKPSTSWKGGPDYEKIKLHKYKQQLMFYELLTRNSRDYSTYAYNAGHLQFVEPDSSGVIHCLTAEYTQEELNRFAELINAVWQRIITFDFPDSSEFEQNYNGMLAFEQWLIDNTK